jgi:hypothetical protein
VHSIRRTLALSLTALAVCLVLTNAAHGSVTHQFLFSFSEVPAEGPLKEPVALPGRVTTLGAMTVDSGHVWIAEHMKGTNNFRVDRFDATTGTFLSQFAHAEEDAPEYLGVAVGHLAGAPEPQAYLAEFQAGLGRIGVYGESGAKLGSWTGAETPAGSFGVLFGVAVDDSASLTDSAVGDVYVPDEGHKVVDVFHPAADGIEHYVTQLPDPEPGGVPVSFSAPQKVAVDAANGEVLVQDGSIVDVFEPTLPGKYAFVRQITGTCPTPGAPCKPGEAIPFTGVSNVTVDGGGGPHSGEIYVADRGAGAVDQFSAAGVFLAKLTATPAGPFRRPQSVAIDAATQDLYVGDEGVEGEGSAVDVFGPTTVVPDVTVTEATSITPASATLNGTVNPAKGGDATCEFEYGTTTSYGTHAECAGPGSNKAPIPEGEAPIPVSAPVAGLQADTTYHYRLDATNASKVLNTGQCPEDCGEFHTTGPGIREDSVSDVASSSATFEATIDPNGAPTSYYFQFAKEPDFSGAVDEPAAPGDAIGSGTTDVPVSRHVQEGLSPSTPYYYRAVAVSELNEGETPTPFYGPIHTFTTQPAAGFAHPDARQWELVSPPDKHGGQLEGDNQSESALQAAAGGGAVTYVAAGPTEPQPQGFQELMQVLSSRTPSGWVSRDIEVPHLEATAAGIEGQEYRLFSSDLTLGALQPFGGFNPSLSAEASEQTAYLRSDLAAGNVPCSDSCYRPLVTGKPGFANVPEGTQFGPTGECSLAEPNTMNSFYCGPEFVGASSDLTHIILSSSVALTTAVPAESPQEVLYEWSEGHLRLVSVLPQGEGEAIVGGQLGALTKGSPTKGRSARAVSLDGTRVIWQHEEPSSVHIYTTDLSGAHPNSARLDTGMSGTSVFQTANSTGSEVYFTNEHNLYLYRVGVGRELVAEGVTGGVLGMATFGAGEPVLGLSDDGSWLYFVADKAIAGVAGAVDGQPNLYVRHAGETRLVAVLSSEDGPDWAHVGFNFESTARVSPDGRWLAFMSDRPLTGYDNRPVGSDQRAEEVYLYDGETGRVHCASCLASGGRPVAAQSCGHSTPTCYELTLGREGNWATGRWLSANVPGWTAAGYQSRYLSSEGRLFFNSVDRLVPQDVNSTWDVYEWEPVGVGGCTAGGAGFSPDSGGCVGLVSSGQSPEESAFIDASESGGDVFFYTQDRLVPQDFDASLDMYDAHVCTAAAPCFAPAAAVPPACSTEASCKASPSLQPDIFGAPASASFSGAGNVSLPKGKTAAQVRAEQLAKALRACRKKKSRHRRHACERKAHRAYGVKGAKKSNNTTRRGK